MPEIHLAEGDRIEWALNVFKRQMQKSGVFRELRRPHARHGAIAGKTLGQAMLRIILADLSMSLDNVRKEINSIDEQILELLGRRRGLATLRAGLSASAISPSSTARWYRQRSAATRCSAALRPPRALRRATT